MKAAILWRVAGVAAMVIVLLALREGSSVRLRNPAGDQAWIRLSWSARPERVEQCRRRSDEELAARPEHMRLRLECTGTFARYRLRLSVDEAEVLSEIVRGGGFRHDRPMHVLHEAAVRPGLVRVRVSLVRIDTVEAVSVAGESDSGAVAMSEREAREQEERVRQAGEGIPPELGLDTTLTLGAGRVVLITYDGTRRALVARTGRE